MVHLWEAIHLALEHGFHETRQGRRFRIDPAAQVELLDRLLELNFARHEEEVRRGLYSKPGRRSGKSRKLPDGSVINDGALFPPPGALF